MTVRISRISADDWEQWRAIRLRSLTESPEAFASSVRTVAAKQDREDLWRSRIATAVGCWLASDGQTPVGMVALDRMPDESLQLVSMFVGAEARGRGVGASLVDAVVAAAGDTPLYLRVMDGNQAAVRVYQRAGFVLTSDCADGEGCLRMDRG